MWESKNAPAICVSWNDAMEFCRKLTERFRGRSPKLPRVQGGQPQGVAPTYRLPTEAEWEYACRAGSTTKYCFGDDESRLGEYAWYIQNSNWRAHPVAQKKPNAWGLYDMHGNVWEWCQDWYHKDYYSNSPVHDPKGPRAGDCRVFRSSPWNLNAQVCRSSVRCSFLADAVGVDYGLGFRVCACVKALP